MLLCNVLLCPDLVLRRGQWNGYRSFHTPPPIDVPVDVVVHDASSVVLLCLAMSTRVALSDLEAQEEKDCICSS